MSRPIAASLHGDAVVLAAGSWAGRFEIDGVDDRVPVRPIRGQLLQLAWTGPPLAARHLGRALLSRARGTTERVLVGATVEDAGFDERTTVAGVRDLIEAVCELVPRRLDGERSPPRGPACGRRRPTLCRSSGRRRCCPNLDLCDRPLSERRPPRAADRAARRGRDARRRSRSDARRDEPAAVRAVMATIRRRRRTGFATASKGSTWHRVGRTTEAMGRVSAWKSTRATEAEAIARLTRWLEWQHEHATALAALQQAERDYHRTIAGSAFASGRGTVAGRDADRGARRRSKPRGCGSTRSAPEDRRRSWPSSPRPRSNSV